MRSILQERSPSGSLVVGEATDMRSWAILIVAAVLVLAVERSLVFAAGFLEDVGNAIGQGVKGTGKIIRKGMDGAGEVVDKGAKGAGRIIEEAGEVIGEGVEDTGRALNRGAR